MALGLLGAHRVGKTTLAEAISNETGMPLILTSTSDVMKAEGVDLKEPLPFERRLYVQHKILDAAIAVWKNEKGFFVTDRTPLDMLAYTMIDGTASSLEDFRELQQYAGRCFKATNDYFFGIVLVQPGIQIVDGGDKVTGALNAAYIEHLSTLMMGLLYDDRVACHALYLRRATLNLKHRVNATLSMVSRLTDRAAEEAAFAAIH